ncbi:hypothetical protein KC365_g3036 [Hortaea werneckii]|nr:hypothetical protein KC342_g6487 [Hortaea werneckii]KAI7103946.1 hypothetical protein KC339_g4891 [Hortaea werneckii]KAI7242585.1 hypothetical protein KC365_g3036 [Hortaea werneckii]KAI7398604.1 hypothetical protein KC328_g4378 [Hortaea werneckii]
MSRKRPAADAAEAAWVADEDRFVLQQSKKKALLRAKSGRASPIDWLAVTLSVLEPGSAQGAWDDDGAKDDEEFEIMEPEIVFEGLGEEESALKELMKGVDGYLGLERGAGRSYWETMKTICQDRLKQIPASSQQTSARGVGSVAGDLDKLLAPKSLPELEKLEKQIRTKLSAGGNIDTDYWEHLLRTLLSYKAKAKLREIGSQITAGRLESLKAEKVKEADSLRAELELSQDDTTNERGPDFKVVERHPLDPEPLLRLRSEDRQLHSMTGPDFAEKLALDRQRVVKKGFIPMQHRQASAASSEPSAKRQRTEEPSSTVTAQQAAFDREVSRGLRDNEELVTTEVPVETKHIDRWPSSVKPRKPRYFCRLTLGYEWNKYNQTHYDADNPPPRVVQGYRFNIFYPDLMPREDGVVRAPTYKIEREGGRKRGEMLAPAGEDDTCVIRFISGPPYEDIAFRIVDKEWDYSAKRERGFRSSFDKGVLTLHFMFKKIYYRK